MNANKDNLEILVVVDLHKIYLYKVIEGPITVERLKGCNWSLDNFTEMNFSNLTEATKF